MAGAPMMPRTATGATRMAGHFGLPISQQSLQPFLDLEKDRHRMMTSRMFAAPAGGALAHLAPVVPESLHGIAGQGTLPMTQAIPQMMGMADPAIGAAGSVMGQWAPILAMGGIGAGAGVLGAYGVSKLLGKYLKGRRERKAQRAAQLGAPKMASILESTPEQGKQGAVMFSDIRFVKFAAAGATGVDTPSSFVEAIRKVAFAAGMLGSALKDHKLSEDEGKVLSDLVEATKMAQDLTSRLRARLQVKQASVGHDFSLKAIAAACHRDAAPANVTKLASGGMGPVMFHENSKVAKAMELLGVNVETLRGVVGGKQTTGYATGLLGLVA